METQDGRRETGLEIPESGVSSPVLKFVSGFRWENRPPDRSPRRETGLETPDDRRETGLRYRHSAPPALFPS